MDLFSTFILFVIMLWDSQLMKKYNREHFDNVFHLPFIYAVIFFCGGMLLVSFFDKPSMLMAYLFLAWLVPVYLSKRNVFLYTDPERPLDYLNGNDLVTKSYVMFGSFKVALLSLYGAILFSIILKGSLAYLAMDMSEIGQVMISVMFYTVFTLGLIYRSARNFSPEGFWNNVGFKKGVSKARSIFIPVFLGLFFVGFASYMILSRGEDQPSTPMNDTLATAGSPLVILVFLAWAWFIAPLFEEIVFRGYCFHVLKKLKGQRFAIYIISASFAFLHIGQYWGDWMAILMVTLMGFTLTLLRAWTGTTLAGLVMHHIYNIGVTIVPIMVLSLNNPYYFEYQAKFDSLDTVQKEELLLKSINQNPDFSAAYNDLAWLYSQENIKLNEALTLVDRALEIVPDSEAYLDTKAEILELLGEYAEALTIRQNILDTSRDQKIKDMQKDRIQHLQELIEIPQNVQDFLRVRFNSFSRLLRMARSTGLDINSSHPIL